jgi:DNA-binding NarL/FixJ family response regulator
VIAISPLRLPEVSAAELRVLELLAQGYSNSTIAEVLVLSPRTIEFHIKQIYLKLDLPPDEGVHRRVMAAVLFRRARPVEDTRTAHAAAA